MAKQTSETNAPVEGDQPVSDQTGAEAPPAVVEPTVDPGDGVAKTAVEGTSVEVTPEAVVGGDTFTPHDLGPDALAEYTAGVDADGDGVPDVEQGEVIETWPAAFRPEADHSISVEGLALAEFYGTQTPEPSPAQRYVVELEDFLRSHAVGGSNRKSEGFYGPKTRKLVNAAYAEYLPNSPEASRNGVVSGQLAAALKAAGAKIGA